jgi:hypothetical protein
MQTKTVLCRLSFLAGMLLTSLTVAKPAQACSDLPNICAQRQQHHDEMNRLFRERDELQQWIGSPEPESRRYDPMQTKINSAFMRMEQIQRVTIEDLKRLSDPQYQKYLRGNWEVFQGKQNAAPGESCIAMFTRQKGLVTVAVPGKDRPGVFLTFIGQSIPRPQQMEIIEVTLNQPNHSPQIIKAFNYIQPGFDSGAITLTVPTIESALAGWQDVQAFDLAIAGKSVSKIEWHSGLSAKEKLRACVSARTPK